ncbi:hypothetical protein T440DRAFT_85218 [Plenodomus tracheiphilus IPT5]|uniref:Uncharacterized protein n=1 Tax=Plenodomus tracheiphilus IPT5 TaxID=1408161 RepID=A0A6A7B5V3_9PLEO|nr:hypothetical protein T440DRAFT_85218 [Plenodomus tracheiphilus IPT5]
MRKTSNADAIACAPRTQKRAIWHGWGGHLGMSARRAAWRAKRHVCPRARNCRRGARHWPLAWFVSGHPILHRTSSRATLPAAAPQHGSMAASWPPVPTPRREAPFASTPGERLPGLVDWHYVTRQTLTLAGIGHYLVVSSTLAFSTSFDLAPRRPS